MEVKWLDDLAYKPKYSNICWKRWKTANLTYIASVLVWWLSRSFSLREFKNNNIRRKHPFCCFTVELFRSIYTFVLDTIQNSLVLNILFPE